ncbi:HD-GYP domain-containing protein [Paenibacillus sp. GCM10012307]|uniref:HD-GYP domain-containing protein n=1 Tax=Paenibacillus roseus TaxID=2798579 RepID=A0A934J4V1_9BACL|nr:HD-GYP domain-containing protein [Paenibacillus roseus]MBJ6361699.1 HD-GYP domain-containing protein [Paenibacillus roseus]
MPTVLLNQVKAGDKLTRDVQTKLGGTLFYKGKVLMSREIEILQAFMVQSVVVETKEGSEEHQSAPPASSAKEEHASEPAAPATAFEQEYFNTVNLLKKVHRQYSPGQVFPILEIRKQLELLIGHIDEYSVLTFIPDVTDTYDYMFHNSVLSALTSYLLARWGGFKQRDWIPAALSGLFHDIGNLKVDRELLIKPGTLTASELEEIRQHTVLGYQLLKPVPAINEGVKLASLQHHERVDGSGYPLGMGGDQIHPYAKIVAIADTFHAMTLKRAYRIPMSPYLVLEEIQKESFGKLDPALVRIFIEKVTRFHNGTVVRLNDDRVGEIVFSDRNHLTRPWVSVNGTIVNLTTERQLYIKEIVKL